MRAPLSSLNIEPKIDRTILRYGIKPLNDQLLRFLLRHSLDLITVKQLRLKFVTYTIHKFHAVLGEG